MLKRWTLGLAAAVLLAPAAVLAQPAITIQPSQPFPLTPAFQAACPAESRALQATWATHHLNTPVTTYVHRLDVTTVQSLELEQREYERSTSGLNSTRQMIGRDPRAEISAAMFAANQCGSRERLRRLQAGAPVVTIPQRFAVGPIEPGIAFVMMLGTGQSVAFTPDKPPPIPAAFQNACPAETQELRGAWSAGSQRGYDRYFPEDFVLTPVVSVNKEIERRDQLIEMVRSLGSAPPAVMRQRIGRDALDIRMHLAYQRAQLCSSRARLGGAPSAAPDYAPNRPTQAAATPAPAARPSALLGGFGAPPPPPSQSSAPQRQADAAAALLGALGRGGGGGISDAMTGVLNGSASPPTSGAPSASEQYQALNAQAQAAYAEQARQQARRGRPYHNSANDATTCMKVESTGTRVEWGISGRMKMINTCGFPVVVSWCSNAKDCAGPGGNMWTVQAGRDWPLFFSDPENPYIRIGACRTAATASPPPPPGAPAPSSRHSDPQPAPGVAFLSNHACD